MFEIFAYNIKKENFILRRNLSADKEKSIKIQNEMSLDIEKLIRHNEVCGFVFLFREVGQI